MFEHVMVSTTTAYHYGVPLRRLGAHGFTAQPRIACPLALLRSSLKLPGDESVGADRTGKSMEWEEHLEEPGRTSRFRTVV